MIKLPALANSWFVLVFILTTGAQNVFAAFGNYNSTLIGSQAAGMGGAYTAGIEDISAIPWYNPAGLAFFRKKSAASAVGIYKKFDTQYGANEDFTKASLRANQGFFRALPSSTGSVIRSDYEPLKEYTFALSILVPEFESIRVDVRNTAENTSSYGFTEENLWVGQATSKKISKSESVGFSLYYTARNFSKSVSDRSSFDGNRKVLYSEERSIVQNGLIFQLGYMKRLSPDLLIGASLRFPSLLLYGSASYADSLIDSASTDQSTNNIIGLSSSSRIPPRLGVGFSWRALPELLIHIDGTYHGAESYWDIDSPEHAEKIEHHEVFNGSLGAEIALRDWLKFRFGGFTNLSSHPDPIPEKVKGQADRVDQLGFSANMVYSSGHVQYTFGGYYTGGKGRSVQRVNQEYAITPRQSQTFSMLVGTSYAF